MKFSYKFSNLIGTVYKSGDIVFSADGNTVLCPVGNKISQYDIPNNRSITLPIEARYNYVSLALSPSGKLLLASEEDGELHVINLHYRNIMYRKRLHRLIKCIKFSPDGKYFALTKEALVFVYLSPGSSQRVFDPFRLERIYDYSKDDVTCMDWSHDSKFIAYGSNEIHICRLHTLAVKTSLHYIIGSRDSVVGVFFEKESYNVLTVSKTGHVTQWKCSVSPDELGDIVESYNKQEASSGSEDDIPDTQEELENADKKKGKHKKKKETEKVDETVPFYYKRHHQMYLDQHVKGRPTVTSCNYVNKLKLLVAAFNSGDFLLIDMNGTGDVLHSLNISDSAITSCILNPTGDWLALGVASAGQLVVWEWQSETYVLKQQSHFSSSQVVCYSPDSLSLVTGGHDGKLKLWSCQSSFCLVTFNEHTGPITGIRFTQSGKAILSSSMDGTVRAFDITRYRNFKTLTSPVPAQFSCLAVDSSGELVSAGATDRHDIYLWSLKTGRLLEVLSGHTGPISSLEFSVLPGSSLLVSTAWDKTIKVWDAISTSTAKESIPIKSDGLCICLRGDGEQVAVASMDGHITMFNPLTGGEQSSLEGRNDLGAGRADSDAITAKSNLKSKAFTTLCYSADGKFLLAAGQSKNVCIYSIEGEMLVKKFQVTQNRSFDAMDEIVNRRKMVENDINLSLVEDRDGEDQGVKLKLPGVRSGDMSKRAFRPEVEVTQVVFSHTGRSWAACTSEGLLVYSLDTDRLFDPLQLQEGQTPEKARKALKQERYATALMIACRLNINILVQEIIENIPVESIQVVVGNLVQLYVESLLKFLGSILETTRHLGLYMKWVVFLLRKHGQSLKTRSSQIQPLLNQLQKAIITHNTNLGKVSNHNEHMLKFLIAQGSLQLRKSADIESSKVIVAKTDSTEEQALQNENDTDVEDVFADDKPEVDKKLDMEV